MESGSIVLALRVTPRGGAARIDGFGHDANGSGFLKLRVSEVAEKGKANKAVIKLLAKEWRLAPSTMAIVSGMNDRNKLLEVTGDPEMLRDRISIWCEKTGIDLGRTENANE